MWKQTRFERAAPVAALCVSAITVTSVLSLAEEARLGSVDLIRVGDQAVKEEPLDLVTSTGTHQLSIEVADTPGQQQLGLMFRTRLPEDKGMLFPHDRPRELQMWMKNTYIPLDMVFIRADGTVHRIEKMTEPFSERIIASNGEVSAVLEIAGGLSDKLGLKPGDRVRNARFGSKD